MDRQSIMVKKTKAVPRQVQPTLFLVPAKMKLLAEQP
jgi:hypothetical protein